MKVKNFLIAGMVALTVIGGISYTVGLYIKKTDKIQTDSVDAILADYKKLSEEINDDNFKKDLVSLCKNKTKFNKKIQEIENKLSELKDRKMEYILQVDKEQKEIEEQERKRKIQEKLGRQRQNQGAACPRDYDGQIALPGSWPKNLEGKLVPPGHWPLDFDGNPIPPRDWPLDNNGFPLPPGVCARDYNGEFMLNGSWNFDLDGILVPPNYWPKDSNGKPIPPPGWPLDENGDPLPPGSLEEPTSYMEDDSANYKPEIVDSSEIDESNEESITSPEDIFKKNLEEMSAWEEQIKISLDYLKSICDKEEQTSQNKPVKKKFPSDCQTTCQNFSQCSIVGGGTVEDKEDDYKMCMEECVGWKEETRICINEKTAKGINRETCNFMVLCIGQEERYNKGINPLKENNMNVDDFIDLIQLKK